MGDVGMGSHAQPITPTCEADTLENLFLAWLNELITEKDLQRMVFSEFVVEIRGGRLTATARGETWDHARHRFRTEVKGATYSQLRSTVTDGRAMFQCIVDV